MWWLTWALVAHGANALVFVVDKTILGTRSQFGDPARYAALSGMLSLLAAGFLFVAPALPTVRIGVGAALAGGCWVAALWFFFGALKADEPSRVVPLTGVAVSLATVVLAAVILGERLTSGQVGGVAALLIGGGLLSVRLSGVSRVPSRVMMSIGAAGGLFAAHFLVMDWLYQGAEPFLAVFAYGRAGVGLVALGVWGVLPRRPQRTQRSKSGWGVGLAFGASKAVGMGALLAQNYAIRLGSASLVNALQGTQYVFVLLLAAAVSVWYPRLFREEIQRAVLIQKLAGIMLVGVGVVLVSG